MKWLQTGLHLGQAVKNVQRLRQILTVFARHGFADIVNRTDFGKYLPQKMADFAKESEDFDVPMHLRLAFEELGPTFVKLGQILATRPDLLDEKFIIEFTKLQDNVGTVPFEAIKTAVEASLKQTLEEAYASFSVTPLASASIGQVHEATLHTGERVVVKVLRPDIRKVVENDIALLMMLARALEKYIPELRILAPVTIVEEFFKTISFEMDFLVEANNMSKIADNMAEIPEIKVPRVYKHLTTSSVMTQEKLEGIRVNNLKALDEAGVDRREVARLGAKAFFKSIMIDGLYHGDLHGGNLFILPDGRIGVIDFGMVGRLSQKGRDQLANIVLALVTEDYENLCFQYAELGSVDASIDFQAFERAVRNSIAPYVGLNMSEVNSGRILLEATRVATEFNVRVPGDWMLVFKALLTTEGMARTLDPQFDLIGVGQELVADMVKAQYSTQRIGKELAWVAKDMLSLLQVLPRQLRWFMRTVSRNGFALEVRAPELAILRKQLDANSRRLASSLLAAGLFVAGSQSLQSTTGPEFLGYPVISWLLFSLATLLFLRTISIRDPKA